MDQQEVDERTRTGFICLRKEKADLSVRSLVGIVGSNLAGGMYVCCKCCVLTGRSLCGGSITRPEESYRMWRG